MIRKTVVQDQRLRDISDASNEFIKEKCGVNGTSTGFWVELNAEKWFAGVDDTFVGQVICIQKQRLPFTCWKRLGINGESMILRSDVASPCTEINCWLVHSSITVLHLVGASSRCQRQELISETNTKDRAWWIQSESVFDRFNGGRTHGGVSWSIGQEQSLPVADLGVIGFQIIIKWKHPELYLVHVHKVANNVKFHSAIVGHNAGRISFSVDFDILGRNLGYQIALIRIDEHLGGHDGFKSLRILW